MLTGATGFIGRRLALGLGGNWRVVSATRAATNDRNAVQLDLAQRESILRTFDAVRPAAVVHTGGVAAPDACELEPELAQRVNVEAVETLAKLCAETKARLVHFSTDLVFDGEKGGYREEDVTR